MSSDVAVSLFDVLLQSTPKQETKLRDCPTLAALKVFLDWLRSEPDLLSDPAFNSFSYVMQFITVSHSICVSLSLTLQVVMHELWNQMPNLQNFLRYVGVCVCAYVKSS